ncbi:MAG TPA: pyrroloquinoline quinone biosynthesis peptide chaperone PqqD [Verrucomicrobiae bacterium]|jgi:coenzyme PQQ biosynthesis protein PqqD
MNAPSAESRATLARGVRLRNDPLTGEPLLLYPEGILPLDESARDILIRCDGKLTLAEIARALSEEYEAEPDDLLPDITECLVQLREEMLVTW